MPQYKLRYFNARGKAEVIRLIFALADVSYEDERFERSEWPGDIKKTIDLPFGQLPTLTIDGEVYCQVLPLTRYLAEKYGFSGKTDLDKLRADMIVHCIEDTLMQIVKVRVETDAVKKSTLLKKFTEEDLPASFVNLEKMLVRNKGGDGYFVGDSLTWADLTLFQHVTSWLPLIDIDPSFINGYPKLKALVERVRKNEKIAAWIAKRPQTEN